MPIPAGRQSFGAVQASFPDGVSVHTVDQANVIQEDGGHCEGRNNYFASAPSRGATLQYVSSQD